jgi:hypothetical protein
MWVQVAGRNGVVQKLCALRLCSEEHSDAAKKGESRKMQEESFGAFSQFFIFFCSSSSRHSVQLLYRAFLVHTTPSDPPYQTYKHNSLRPTTQSARWRQFLKRLFRSRK